MSVCDKLITFTRGFINLTTGIGTKDYPNNMVFLALQAVAGRHISTEHQKKLITSSVRHPLKPKESKCIIFGHRLAIVFLVKHIKKKRFASVKKGENAVKSQEATF